MKTLRYTLLNVVIVGALCLAPSFAIAQSDDAVLVTVTEVVTEDMSPMVPTAGTVFSRNATQITAGLAARIEWIAEPGDFIRRGDVVARFDCDMLELRREELLATAEREQVNLETFSREAARLEEARAKLVASETQLILMQGERGRAASDLKIAEVRIRQTDNELERCLARAPFDGVVTARMRTAGEDVERSTVLAAMTDTENLEVRASVPIRYLPRIRAGSITPVQINTLRFEGRIRKAVPAGDAASQTFEVRIDLPASAPDFIAAGQLVSVSLPLAASSVMTVPRDSIVLREEGTFVMRITDDGTAEKVTIQVDDATGQRVAVRGELNPGDRVAVRGAEALDDGELVAIRTET
ncbi:MAG: efflux RND transporter periplasmic adaptor subunit [Woeseiaceae bacterium]|nr:efflux RND transporter periplasmic adaptor subunit [Woeseiaceae bacterium]